MDAFKDRLSQRARDTSGPVFAHPCRWGALEPREAALADAAEAHDRAAVAGAPAGAAGNKV